MASEDKNFYSRWIPYDKWAFLRAAYQNIKTQSIKMGGSTITMVTARNIFLEQELRNEWNEKDPKEKRHTKIYRKIREAIYAAYLEYHYGKENRWKILELYLNIANCGRNLYGVVACSHYWYGKEPKELSIGEAGWIAELWRRPRYWRMEPEDQDEALKHRGLVLNQLVNERIITPTEREEFNKLPLPKGGKQISPGCNAPHAAEFARVQIVEEMRLVDEGLRVYTTLNCDWQNVGAQALHSALDAMKKRNPKLENDLWGALIAIDTHGGGIKVFAQEPPFAENEYRIDLIKRHAGSAVKPFTYLAGLLHRLRMSCADEGTGPCKLNDSPGISIYVNPQVGRKYIHNFPDNRPPYNGMVEPIFGLLRSLNAGTMSMLKGVSGGIGLITKDDVTEVMLRLGIELSQIPKEMARREALKNLIRWFPKESETKLRARRDKMSHEEIESWTGMSITIISKDLAERVGISRLYYDPGKTVAIGSVDISPLEMVRAWSAFYGPMVEPRVVEEIRNEAGEQIPYLAPEPVNAMENLWIATKKEALRQTQIKPAYEQLKQKELEKRRAEAIEQKKQPPSNFPSAYCKNLWNGQEKQRSLLMKMRYDAMLQQKRLKYNKH